MSDVIHRNVKITIWNDQKFFSLSDDGQLVWFHLFTNPMTNGLGLYHAPIEGLAASKRWPLERYRKGFGEGLGKRLFEYDETYQVIYFPKFIKHNKPANPNVLKSLIKAWDYIPDTSFKALLHADLKGLGEGFAKVMANVPLNVTPYVSQSVPETVTGTVTGTDTVERIAPGGAVNPSEDDIDPPKPASIPFAKILDLYHEHCPDFPKVHKLSETRKGHVRQRHLGDMERNLEVWETYFKFSQDSPFLMGKTHHQFKTTFDWLINEANMLKIIEGNYHDSNGLNRSGPHEPKQTPADRIRARIDEDDPGRSGEADGSVVASYDRNVPPALDGPSGGGTQRDLGSSVDGSDPGADWDGYQGMQG